MKVWQGVGYLHSLKVISSYKIYLLQRRNANFLIKKILVHITQCSKLTSTVIGKIGMIHLLIWYTEKNTVFSLWYSTQNTQPESSHKSLFPTNYNFPLDSYQALIIYNDIIYITYLFRIPNLELRKPDMEILGHHSPWKYTKLNTKWLGERITLKKATDLLWISTSLS